MMIALIISDVLLILLLVWHFLLKRGIKKVSAEFHNSIQNKLGEQHVFCPVPDRQLEKLCVITSYSIHYTKLYDMYHRFGRGDGIGSSKKIRF